MTSWSITSFRHGDMCMQGQDHSSNNTAHDLTMTMPAPAPGHATPSAAAPGNEAVAGLDIGSIPAPALASQLQPRPPGHGNSQPPAAAQACTSGPADACQPLLMWVRPLMQRSGDSLLFEMRPAQDLPEGCWAQSMRLNSWCEPCSRLRRACPSTSAVLSAAAMTYVSLRGELTLDRGSLTFSVPRFGGAGCAMYHVVCGAAVQARLGLGCGGQGRAGAAGRQTGQNCAEEGPQSLLGVLAQARTTCASGKP